MILSKNTSTTAVLFMALTQLGLARGSEPREVTIESLEAGSVESGALIRITGKYKELIDGDLVLYGTGVRFLLGTPELKKRVLDFQAHKDNLTLLGTTRADGGARFVDVTEIQAASSDVEVFESEEKRLRGNDKESQRACIGVLRRVLSAYQVHADPSLPPLVRRLFTRSLGGGTSPTDAETTASRLEIIREIHQAIQEMDMTVELAAELEAKSADKAAAIEFLKGLNARRRSGKWLSYAQFKRKEGFVEQEGRWLSAHEKELLDAIERYRRDRQSVPVLRKRTDKEYQLLAEKGAIEEGMKLEEVATSLGFPDRVERRLFEGKEVDQWIYGNKCCYFYAGVLVLKPE